LSRRPDLTDKVKAELVRDYLRGDKTIVIQMEYKVSPGEMYRILSARQVSFRTCGTARPGRKPRALIVDNRQLLPAGNPFRVALWNFTLESWEWKWDITFKKMAELLVEYLEREPVATIDALGFANLPFKAEQLVDRAFQMLVEYNLSHDPKFERLTDDTWKLRRRNV